MARFSFSSIRVRLMFLLILAGIPAVLLNVYEAVKNREVIASRLRTETRQLTKLTVANQEYWIEGARQLLVSLGHLPIILNQAVVEALQEGKPGNSSSSLPEDKDVYQLYNERLVNKLKHTLYKLEEEIFERKKVEEALRETNEYLENLFNYANTPIIVWDPQFRITRFNRAFELLTGRKGRDVIGKHLKILFPSEDVEKSMKLIERTLSG